MKVTFSLDPPILFKYCSTAAVKTLSSLRIKVTPPNEFNDPFEFLPRLEIDLPKEAIVRRMTSKKLMRENWHFVRKHLGVNPSLQEFERLYKGKLFASRGREIRETAHLLNELAHEHKQGVVHYMSRRFGIVCYSELADHILMWSHYAQSHRGLVLGFDVRHPFLRKGGNLVPVLYRSERCDGRFDLRGMRLREDPTTLLRTKSLHWSYEREWRQLFPLRKCIKVVNAGNPEVLYFKRIPAKALTQVILGFRVQPEIEDSVRSALSFPALQHVTLRRAVLHERNYQVTIVDA